MVLHTRWHEDDLSGRLGKDTDTAWEVVNLPAINDAGEALWPERWSAVALEKRRKLVGEYDWASLFLGRPRPRGGALFNGSHFYDKLPDGYRLAVGFDLAYTAKSYADYSVIVVMAEAGGVYYLLDVWRAQVPAPQAASKLAELRAKLPRPIPFLSFVGGTEKGVIDMMNFGSSLGLIGLPATTDKFVRAQPASSAWNQGKILIPRKKAKGATGFANGESPDWVAPLLSEVTGFTGISDPNDDQVDALVSAFAALQTGRRVDNSNLPVA